MASDLLDQDASVAAQASSPAKAERDEGAAKGHRLTKPTSNQVRNNGPGMARVSKGRARRDQLSFRARETPPT